MAELTLEQALDWFGLDPATVDKGAVKTAFWELAKKCHPDTKKNYDEKLAASENFKAAENARGMILTALDVGLLPRPIKDKPISELEVEVDAPQPPKPEPNTEAHKPNPFSWKRSPREKYDQRHPRPLERLSALPVIGWLFEVVFVTGAGVALFVAMVPVVLIGTLVEIFLGAMFLILMLLELRGIQAQEPKFKFNWQRTFGAMNSLKGYLLAYVLTLVGTYLLNLGGDGATLALSWGLASFVMTVMALDELYSFVRYMFVAREFRQAVVAAIDEGHTSNSVEPDQTSRRK